VDQNETPTDQCVCEMSSSNIEYPLLAGTEHHHHARMTMLPSRGVLRPKRTLEDGFSVPGNALIKNSDSHSRPSFVYSSPRTGLRISQPTGSHVSVNGKKMLWCSQCSANTEVQAHACPTRRSSFCVDLLETAVSKL